MWSSPQYSCRSAAGAGKYRLSVTRRIHGGRGLTRKRNRREGRENKPDPPAGTQKQQVQEPTERLRFCLSARNIQVSTETVLMASLLFKEAHLERGEAELPGAWPHLDRQPGAVIS